MSSQLLCLSSTDFNIQPILYRTICGMLYYSGMVFALKTFLRKWQSRSLLIFTFHTVTTETPRSYAYGLAKSLYNEMPVSQFRNWLSYLWSRYEVVSFPEGFARLSEKGKDLAAITFDDGYESVYTTAFPILQEYRMPLIVFLTTDYIGRVWSAGDHNDGKPMLSWGQIREMRVKGCTFGAHTCTHPTLSTIPEARARDEIISSKEVIEYQLGEPVSLFAYPFGWPGSFTSKHEQLVQEAGFHYAFTMIEGYNRKTISPWIMRRVYPSLPRFVMDSCLTIRDFREQVMLRSGAQVDHIRVLR